ncbi:hypothetical protein VTL71DRAFT_7919 [Oculimacula yallundae]|uniref:Uncharacterized protein n=1 Tax=Oculimacula yallundae TaxID=86028 RepID=A0ABR4CW27_9HELO
MSSTTRALDLRLSLMQVHLHLCTFIPLLSSYHGPKLRAAEKSGVSFLLCNRLFSARNIRSVGRRAQDQSQLGDFGVIPGTDIFTSRSALSFSQHIMSPCTNIAALRWASLTISAFAMPYEAVFDFVVFSRQSKFESTQKSQPQIP